MATDEQIERVWTVNNLHKELAALYYTKSRDSRWINQLWEEIEYQETLLRLDAVEGPWN